MSLAQILVFAAVAVLSGSLGQTRWRSWILMVSSLLAMYWMQPSTPIRNLDFWLPFLTIVLSVSSWAATQSLTREVLRENLAAGLLVAGVIVLIGLNRYFGAFCCLIPSRPPELAWVLVALVCAIAIILLLGFWSAKNKLPIYGLTISILGLFVLIKTPLLAGQASATLRTLSGQQAELASALDIRWLGFSYLAFRLVHTLRDRLSGRLAGISLQEYLIYIVFFPTFTAGPIDRLQHFIQELHAGCKLNTDMFLVGGQRIVWGLFKKFVLADGLAIFALGPSNSAQVTSSGWLWILLYAYSFRLFLDFSGYTDIAIGLGILLGIHLPENFDKPYLKQNLTAFWNSWHITLAQWFRAYFFNPVTRFLRTSERRLSMALIIFLGQMGTMLLIGLWHGVTWNFAAWGAWHGIGLFVHNRWSDTVRLRLGYLEDHPRLRKGLGAAGTLLTFHYVTLGWVWFALPGPQNALQVFIKLFSA